MKLGALLILAVSCGRAWAADAGEGLGVGLALGSPSGVTISPQLTPSLSLDFLVGQSFYDGWDASRVMFSLDVDAIVYELARTNNARLHLYVGGGVNLWLWGSSSFETGAEVPLGLAVNLQRIPLQLYGELLPQWVFVSWRGPEIGASVGGRWWFRLH